jgi:predicted GNAT superfamily acetyltransferase
MPDVTIRPLTSEADLAAGVAMQRLTWGDQFTEVVPATMLQISQKVGGVAAGAFDKQNRMIGFVFGLSGVRQGRLVHWSHMLAVRPEARGLGLGKRLKLYQREVLLQAGIGEVRWTFDPLVAQNANLNLNALGAEIETYVPDMYGDDTGSDLHSGLGTDRLVVLWMIGSDKVTRAIDGEAAALDPGWADAPIANPGGSNAKLSAEAIVRIEVPADIQRVKAEAFPTARAWRETTRRAFSWYLERGYRVAGFAPGGAAQPSHYVLSRAQR